MPSSISKAQADALASGFFDDSISKDAVSDYFTRTDTGLVPKNSLSTLLQMAGFLVGTAQENLATAGRIGTGALSESFKILDPRVVNGVAMSVDIEANFYFQFVDGGVKGTKGGSGKFAFKSDRVSKKMMVAIRKWIIKEGIRGRSDRKYRGISKREDFRKSITSTSQSVAYAMARSIKQKGLKRTNFLLNAVKATRGKVKQELGKSFKLDVIASLPNKI